MNWRRSRSHPGAPPFCLVARRCLSCTITLCASAVAAASYAKAIARMITTIERGRMTVVLGFTAASAGCASSASATDMTCCHMMYLHYCLVVVDNVRVSGNGFAFSRERNLNAVIVPR